MSSLKDIMDVDVEPLESQAYRRLRQAAQQQPLPIPSSAESTRTASQSVRHDHDNVEDPVKRRKSNRTRQPDTEAITSSSTHQRDHAAGDEMDYQTGFQVATNPQPSSSGTPGRSTRGLEHVSELPVKYTPVTGRISRAKKGVKVHTCDQCPDKIFTRAEHLRRHKLSHEKPSFPCTFQDCERAFYRPDLLTRHMQRHETQGEKPYKSGRSRTSSVASDGQSPFLKANTPQASAGPSQNPLSNSLAPRALPSDEHTLAGSGFGHTSRTFSSTGYSHRANPHPHKRARSVALPDPESYNSLSVGTTPIRSGSSNYDLPITDPFTDPSQPRFNGLFTAAPTAEFNSYPATPQLHLLQIPEEPLMPALSYTHENSPWCSSASSNCSAQSEGPRGTRYWASSADRTSSASTIPDWPIPVGVLQWSNTTTTTPQELTIPAFESILDQYDPSYITSPRAVNSTRTMLNVPNSSGFYQVEAAVGTPTLPTYKTFAQNTSASSSQFIDPGLDVDRRRKPMVGSPQLESVSINTVITCPIPTEGLDNYIGSYFQHFHRFFPIIHKPTFSRDQDGLLTLAIAAIGTQYHSQPEARIKGSELNESAQKAIELRLNWSTNTMQAILLTEMFNRFRGIKANVRLSRHFDELYSRLLNGSMPNQTQGLSQRDAQSWYEWIDIEARQRLLATCFMFDVHQSIYHEKSRSKARREPSSNNELSLPCPESLWTAQTASEWSSLSSIYTTQLLHQIESDISPQGILERSPFSQTLLICSFAARLPKRTDPTYPNDFVPSTPSPTIDQLVTLFPASPLAHIYLALHHTPLHDLLAISGDTWVFAKKITPPSSFHAAQSRLRTWSSSLAAAQATNHACRILSSALSTGFGVPGAYPTTFDELKIGTLCICDYWSLYVSALICWAFGNRYQALSSSSRTPSSATLAPSPANPNLSSTLITEIDASSSTASTPTPLPLNETSQRALSYVDSMLSLNVEDLLTSKASFKGDTSNVIEAVKQRLEMEAVGNKSALLMDAIVVLGKIRVGGRGKWF